MEKFCANLEQHSEVIINCDKTELLLTKKDKNLTMNKSFVTYAKKNLMNFKVCNYSHYTGKYKSSAHSICNLKYKTPKDVPAVFHNGSNYDNHFLTKCDSFQKKSACQRIWRSIWVPSRKIEKYINLSEPIKKDNENGRTVPYKKNSLKV